MAADADIEVDHQTQLFGAGILGREIGHGRGRP
jgi:hypothetical protein